MVGGNQHRMHGSREQGPRQGPRGEAHLASTGELLYGGSGINAISYMKDTVSISSTCDGVILIQYAVPCQYDIRITHCAFFGPPIKFSNSIQK